MDSKCSIKDIEYNTLTEKDIQTFVKELRKTDLINALQEALEYGD